MSRSLDNVKEFHQVFGHPVKDLPEIPSESRVELRLSLLLEELTELAQASGAKGLIKFRNLMLESVKKIDEGITSPHSKDGNIVECADAFADIDYVLNGAVHEYGLGKVFDLCKEEVHRSNMSKVCKDQDEALETIKNNAKKESCSYKYSPEAEGYLVYRKSDGKTIKSINYSPANLSQFIK